MDLEGIVKKILPRITELGLTAESSEAAVIEDMKRLPQDMLEDLGEEGVVSFLLCAVKFADAFFIDFEGLEYDAFLKQIQELSGGELAFEDVKIDVSEETIEKGEGECKISFRCNTRQYDYSAVFCYDWFDAGFITYLNGIFGEQGIEKRLILFGDANGCLITYQKPEFCERIREVLPMLEADVA